MITTKRTLLAFALSAVAAATTGAQAEDTAKPAQDYRVQYEFLIGDWDAAVSLEQADGKSVDYHARWHNHWLANGRVLLQEWTEPGSAGLELRSYVPEKDMWQGRNIYVPSPGTWYENTAKRVGEAMIVTTHRSDASGKTIVHKEIYSAMGPDHFSIRTEVSSDGEKTWQPGSYRAAMTRLKGD